GAARGRAPRGRSHRQRRSAAHARCAGVVRRARRRMNSGDFLANMAASSRVRSLSAQAVTPARELRARIADLPPAPVLAFDAFDLIAEVKLRSPPAGLLKAADAENVGERVASYARAGAAAVSIL